MKTYKNPILHIDYSDPDVIRVGADFYMTASSFNNVPGLPILHSKDLVNWEIINYALTEIPFLVYSTPQYGKAVWAPSLRFHNGYFMIYIGFPDEGIMMVRTRDIRGEWEKPICLKQTRGYIDTCPFWDDDGSAYLVNAFAKSRIGFKSVLAIHKMNEDGTALLDEFRIIYDGNSNNPTIEGPKMYKRNGYYYISAPAGGVTTGWQVILRSKNIYGPYEEKIVLHQGDSVINGPHQGAWVDTEKGDHWFVHFQDKHAYGRIVHLQPMRFVDDWPEIGIDTNGDGIGEPVLAYEMPIDNQESKTHQMSDEFENEFGLQWQWNANPCPEFYSLEREGYLRLHSVQGTTIGMLPQVLTQKFPLEKFIFTAKMEFKPSSIGERAGIVILGREYAALCLVSGKNEIYLNRVDGFIADKAEIVTHSQRVNTNEIYFRVTVFEKARCELSYSFDNEKFIQIGNDFFAQPNIWVGAKLGLFACGVSESYGYTDFDWVRVEALE